VLYEPAMNVRHASCGRDCRTTSLTDR
jgi:hypothetical protein